MTETMTKLQDIFRDFFDDEDIVLTDETTADDIDGWDSLTHVQLIVAVEKAFSVKFSTVEVMKLKNVGEFAALIEKKTA
ncbi:MAG: acyl carrier protein [Lachnospiraceae bacterium]|nr:acyl carrier protein [Lachnospiraceae bacterium]MBR0149600.1 acyl carrier protein [Lachnospiraceae bacterium]MBR4175211.1 acyl carrier protein [Lachnospiraceae bacterium]